MSAYIPVAGWLSSSSVSGSSATAGVPIWSDNLDSLSEIASSISVSVSPSSVDRLPMAVDKASYSEAPCSTKASTSAYIPVASSSSVSGSSGVPNRSLTSDIWACCPSRSAKSPEASSSSVAGVPTISLTIPVTSSLLRSSKSPNAVVTILVTSSSLRSFRLPTNA